jgi:type IV secretion system protein VirB6
MDSYLGISNILSLVDAAIQNYTQSTYQALSGALAPTMKLLLILYVALFGAAHLTGRSPFDLWRTVKHLFVMVIVTAFVTQWDFFALYFGNVFTDGPAKLMAVIAGGSSDPNAMLGDVLNRGILAANAINHLAGFSTLGFLIVGYSIFYMTLFSVAYALYLLVLSKIALAILLGLAPLFFPLALFTTTRDFFSHYLKQVLNFALIPVFTSAVLVIMLKIPQQALIRLQAVVASHSGFGGRECVFVLLSFFIVLGLLHQVTGFAAGVSGGGLHLHPGGFAAVAAGLAVFAAQSSAKRMMKGGKWTFGKAQSLYNSKKERKAKESVPYDVSRN